MSNIKILLLITAFMAITIYIILSTLIVEIEVNKYDSFSTVKEYKAIKNGWIPAILPNSASKIVESHGSDNSEIFGSFQYEESDETNFTKQLRQFNSTDKIFIWENFLFKVDKNLNMVKFKKI